MDHHFVQQFLERFEDLLLIFLKAGKIQGTLLNALRSRDHDGGYLKILYYHQVSILKPNGANRHIIIIIPCDNRGLALPENFLTFA